MPRRTDYELKRHYESNEEVQFRFPRFEDYRRHYRGLHPVKRGESSQNNPPPRAVLQ